MGRTSAGSRRSPGVKLKTLCDIDENNFAKRVAEVEKKFGYKPDTAWDMRKVFDDKDIHAVTFATPNHWHALGSIWAAQAGKHVYVEKPACYGAWEGRQMVNAARKHKVLMQVGFQNRSRKNAAAAVQFIKEGKLGKVYRARGLCFKPRLNIGRYPDGPMAADAKPIPMVKNDAPYTASYLEKVHYDNWIGPAAAKPFNPNRFHYNWHWQFEYGGGDTANQGPHQFDVARWGLGREDYPVRVRSTGGLFLYKDSSRTPRTSRPACSSTPMAPSWSSPPAACPATRRVTSASASSSTAAKAGWRSTPRATGRPSWVRRASPGRTARRSPPRRATPWSPPAPARAATTATSSRR